MNNKTNYKFNKIVLVGDTIGVPRLLNHIDKSLVIAIVAASVRPQYHTSLEKIADNLNIPYIVQPKFNSTEYKQFVMSLSELRPDMLICYSYSMLIQQDVLKIFDYNCINIHGAFLPKNRGPNSTQWSILHNEDKVGITIHYMGFGFDNGDIIDQEYRWINYSEDREVINKDLNGLGEYLLKNNIYHILMGNNKRYKQSENEATFTKRLTKESAKLDLKNMSSLEIYNWIRTQVKPYDGAFIEKKDGSKVFFDEMISLVDIFKLKNIIYKGVKVYLSSIEKENLPKLFEWIDDSTLLHFNSRYKPISKIHYQQWFKNIQSIDNAVIVGIKKSLNDNFIGSIQLHSIDFISKKAELQITMSTDIEQSIENTKESIELLLEYAKKDLNLKKIYLYVFSDNKRAKKLYISSGFNEVGILKEHSYINNEWKDEIIMERFL